ncbi:MAG: hypothetical protein M3R70_10050 [Actinomycetota bacterium]|nr:hypothetical protein [Actinomycetota bacterium]
MELVVQHRLALAIVVLAFAATAGVFSFARPQYRVAADGGKALVFPEAKAPAHGWTWAAGTPGFRFGQDHDTWNIAHLRPAELVAARRRAVAAGVAPDSLRVLQVSRTRPEIRPQVLLAGRDDAGRTCIGVQLHQRSASFTCPPRLDRAVGLVIAEAAPRHLQQSGMFLIGISRADVTRVTVASPGSTYVDARHAPAVRRPFGPQTVYERAPLSWWGTFVDSTSQPGRWHAHVVFYGAHGQLAALDVRFKHAGERFVLAP